MARGRPVVAAPDERFRRKISVANGGCWLWTAYIDRKGYGVFGINQRELVKAHRYSYELHVGPIPEGMQIDHLCRVRHCVNPAHLEPVTNRENVIRGNAARPKRTHCKHGHEFTEENTYIHPQRASRHCKTCAKIRSTAA